MTRGDRRHVAIHEVGHTIVALAHGAESAILSISRGRTPTGWASIVYRPHTGPLVIAAGGFAGTIAEIIYDHPNAGEEEIMDCVVYDESWKFSHSDMHAIHAIHRYWRYRAAVRAVKTLKHHWPTTHRLTNGLLNARGFFVVGRECLNPIRFNAGEVQEFLVRTRVGPR